MGPAASGPLPVYELVPTFLRAADAAVLPLITNDDELIAPIPPNDASDAVLKPILKTDVPALNDVTISPNTESYEKRSINLKPSNQQDRLGRAEPSRN